MRICSIAIMGGLYLAGALPTGAQEIGRGELAFAPCEFDRVEVPVSCTIVEVPENHSHVKGSTIDLRVGFLPALEKPTDPPVFVIQGGPGGASTDLIRLMQEHPARSNRDFVFVDQRGTGASNPLICPTRPGAMDPVSSARGCAERFDAILTQFTTRHAVHDLDVVREAMGYSSISLIGGSYGTRVAIDYLRQYPDRTESLILDAVVPPGYATPLEIPLAADAALNNWLTECERNVMCADAFPNVRAELHQVIGQLEENPVRMRMRSPAGGEREMVFDAERFRMTLFQMLYRSRTAVRIPLTIHQAATGDISSLLGQARGGSGSMQARRPGGKPSGRSTPGTPGAARNGPSSMAAGMMMTIVCNEDVPLLALEEVRSTIKDTWMGASRLDATWNLCETWPRAELPDDFHAPLTSDAPVLMFHGEWDPTIRIGAVQEFQSELPNSTIVVTPKSGHTSLATNCNQAISAQFLSSGSVEGLDTACAETHQRESFIVK